MADEKAYCRKKDSQIFFEKVVAGNKTFRLFDSGRTP